MPELKGELKLTISRQEEKLAELLNQQRVHEDGLAKAALFGDVMLRKNSLDQHQSRLEEIRKQIEVHAASIKVLESVRNRSLDLLLRWLGPLLGGAALLWNIAKGL